jgi:hypothetical protein
MDFANVLGCKFWVIGLYLGQRGKSGVHFASISLAGAYLSSFSKTNGLC